MKSVKLYTGLPAEVETLDQTVGPVTAEDVSHSKMLVMPELVHQLQLELLPSNHEQNALNVHS